MEEDCSACGWGELYLTRLHDGLTPTDDMYHDLCSCRFDRRHRRGGLREIQ